MHDDWRPPQLIEQNLNKYDLVTANLPYVPSKSKIENTVKHEPQESIFGGKDGLIFIRELINILPRILNNNNSIAIFEIDPSQAEYFHNLGGTFNVELIKDIQDQDRVAVLNLI